MKNCTNKCQTCITEETSSCERPSLPNDMATTMAYIPLQLDLSHYSAEKALCRGTLFSDLDKPFKGRCTC